MGRLDSTDEQPVFMTGPAVEVFRGEIALLDRHVVVAERLVEAHLEVRRGFPLADDQVRRARRKSPAGKSLVLVPGITIERGGT